MMQRQSSCRFHIDHPACRCDVCCVRRLDTEEPRDATPTPDSLRRAQTPPLALRVLSYACYYLLGGNHADCEAMR